jgi:hypothetical protein
MSFVSTDENSDEYAFKVRFVPKDKGLTARFEPEASFRTRQPEPGEYDRKLSVAVEASRDHGIVTIPVRLPRYLMPEWSQAEWSRLVDYEIGFFHNFVDEAVVQCLSLALVANDDRRKEILRTANEVVVDFRGDLPNKYLPMMLGGYKIGVYRSGNNWPIWLSIEPTYDLAQLKAESIRTEAGLPKDKSITATGALANYLKGGLGSPIISNASARMDIRGWMPIIAVSMIGLVAWLIK